MWIGTGCSWWMWVGNTVVGLVCVGGDWKMWIGTGCSWWM